MTTLIFSNSRYQGSDGVPLCPATRINERDDQVALPFVKFGVFVFDQIGNDDGDDYSDMFQLAATNVMVEFLFYLKFCKECNDYSDIFNLQAPRQ